MLNIIEQQPYSYIGDTRLNDVKHYRATVI